MSPRALRTAIILALYSLAIFGFGGALCLHWARQDAELFAYSEKRMAAAAEARCGRTGTLYATPYAGTYACGYANEAGEVVFRTLDESAMSGVK